MTEPVRIPADVEREDRLVAGLTARQVAILAVTGLVLYAAWMLTRTVVPLPIFLLAAVPIGATAAVLGLGQRDGLSLDRLMLAAIRQALAPGHQVAEPDGIRPAPRWLANPTHSASSGGQKRISPVPLRLPAEGVTDTGIVDLGDEGLAIVAAASTVNFALRTPDEQQALVAGFGSWLHSLTSAVQIVIRTERLDLSAQIGDLRNRAGGLPHPALEKAAIEHADYLAQLAGQATLLRRQVLLIFREDRDSADNAARRAAEDRLLRRLSETVELLAPLGITVTPLESDAATTVLTAACNPDSILPPSTELAAPDDVITTSHDEVVAERSGSR
jgi:hypothetical protein